ncbi:MAG TPA: hypothetical protein VHA30_02250 [Patescibacteria group bacterium]|nr:hypothetical protein [Patescibacteria group bacterium]
MNRAMSAKNKIVLLAVLWLVLGCAMFLYFFQILDNANLKTVADMADQQKKLATLQAQGNGYKKAQDDLAQFAQEPYQPADFFSKDVTLVKEIQTLEDLGQRYGVDMQLSGLSGTVDSASKAPTTRTGIVSVPYSINLTGDFNSVVEFIEHLENLSFITNATGLTVSAASGGQVNANLTAMFYLQK